MKRQITLIITMLMLACSWGFVAAQSTKTTSLTTYLTTSSKPITLSQRLKDKSIAPLNSTTSYANPNKILNEGNIFAEQYLVALWRELDIMYITLNDYRQGLITTQTKIAPGGSTSDCAGLTNADVVALMSKSPQFRDRISLYPTLKIEEFDTVILDNACRKWVSCVGESARTSYNSLTAAQAKWSLCSDRITSQFFAFYDTQLLARNFDIINQYNNIFIDGSGDNAPFDLGDDIRTLMEHHFEYLVKPVDSTKATNTLSTVKGAPVTRLPDELIASTQQLLAALQVDTTIDPRQDAQIASLIGQFTTVTGSSAIVPTGSILNACVDPIIAKENVDSILQQLQQTQQATQQYNASFNTDQLLNNAINGSLDPSTLTTTPVRLSALTAPDRTMEAAIMPTSLAASPGGSDIASINDADLPPAGTGGSKAIGDVSIALSATGGVDSMKQCASSCVQKYSKENSSCIQDCKDKGEIGGILNMRACRQQCFNAKIACSAACFCQYQGSTTPTTGDVKKIHEMFEIRRCLVPTNKLRNPVDSSCIRTDPDTGVIKGSSIQCLLDRTIEQGTYNRESGQGGLRVKPKEWLQLTNKFDLTKMVRFTIGVTKSIRKDPEKHKDIDESQAKQDYVSESLMDPVLFNSQIVGKTQDELGAWIEQQIQMRQDITQQAQAVKTIVSQK